MATRGARFTGGGRSSTGTTQVAVFMHARSLLCVCRCNTCMWQEHTLSVRARTCCLPGCLQGPLGSVQLWPYTGFGWHLGGFRVEVGERGVAERQRLVASQTRRLTERQQQKHQQKPHTPQPCIHAAISATDLSDFSDLSNFSC